MPTEVLTIITMLSLFFSLVVTLISVQTESHIAESICTQLYSQTLDYQQCTQRELAKIIKEIPCKK